LRSKIRTLEERKSALPLFSPPLVGGDEGEGE